MANGAHNKKTDRLAFQNSANYFASCECSLTTFRSILKWHTEFGHLNRGDMLTSEQHEENVLCT
ncbi:hypothetical protein DQD56_19635 [Salmonella enterica subsp. enterica serovar Schwarzengrund]|nr:hypothetical protein CHC58_24805 [Salmonella enterica]EAA4206634.1 hypothetical protein [Salmonella enterica subsp. enterica serovar Schwarzengrund]EAB8083264.1 hypothetical protein [Salmonella enterica subsp. enterica serovar Typhi]EBW6697279.1 hypothetical protein [Salmonella enterica subsp. enterica serovar Typhimurium]ECG0807722.1 hypothetical protein [Salmonella enterica subsp. enterica]ECT8521939.1 hypothetical protein [Salmonella enterica subsp. enterica serovar Bovismorbificans]EFO